MSYTIRCNKCDTIVIISDYPLRIKKGAVVTCYSCGYKKSDSDIPDFLRGIFK